MRPWIWCRAQRGNDSWTTTNSSFSFLTPVGSPDCVCSTLKVPFTRLILKYSVQQLPRKKISADQSNKSRRSTTWFMNSAAEADGAVDRCDMTYELQNYCLFCCMMAPLCDSLRPRTSSSPASIFNPQIHARACTCTRACVRLGSCKSVRHLN